MPPFSFSSSKIHRPTLPPTVLTLSVALFIVLADNRLFWHSFTTRLGLHSWDHWTFVIIVGVAFALLFNLMLTLFAFRPIFKPILILLLLLAALIGYFSDTYGVIIDKTMLHNILETDFGEASELVTPSFFNHLLWFGILPATLVAMTRSRFGSAKRELLVRAGVILVSLSMLFATGMTYFKQFVLFGRENQDLQMYLNPYYPLYSLRQVLKKTYWAHAEEPLRVVAADAIKRREGSRTVMVLVVGETARAQEFAFNGYERDTNPELTLREVVNFPRVQACGTSTAESLPCIFSAQGQENYRRSRAEREENLLDILQRVGVSVLWRDNNSGSKKVADRIPFEDLSRRNDPDLCENNNCFDEILLRDLEQRLRETTGDMLIVLHMQGSHGPSYYRRTPEAFKAFSPECTQDNIQDCSRQTIVNAYDNTILYTDHVLAQLIDLLQNQKFPTAMLYVSDHGESLGENGLYLHGLPYSLAPAEQKEVPMIFWASPDFIARKSLDMSALQSRRQGHYSHDVIFHSLLGLFDIDSSSYQPELDIFSTCREPAPPLARQR